MNALLYLAQSQGPAPSQGGGLPLIGIVMMVFLGLFMILAIAFWIWALVDCIKNEPSTGNDKIIWIIVIALLHWLGAVIYFFARRPKRIAELGH